MSEGRERRLLSGDVVGSWSHQDQEGGGLILASHLVDKRESIHQREEGALEGAIGGDSYVILIGYVECLLKGG